jgi:hypothetical protein
MASTTLGTIQSLLYEMRGPMRSLCPTRTSYLATLDGPEEPGTDHAAQNPRQFDGSPVVPLDTVAMQAGCCWLAHQRR